MKASAIRVRKISMPWSHTSSGGFSVDNPTLNRLFVLHFLLPFVILAVVVLHIAALHRFGSNNPLGIDTKGPQDTIPFHPYYTVKDMFGLGIFMIFFAFWVFWAPNALGDPVNYDPANPLSTPEHIVPEWYYLPFYAILRSIPDKLTGVIAMGASILILFVLPWLDRSPVRSGRYRPAIKWFFWILVFDCVILMFCGKYAPEAYWTPFTGEIVDTDTFTERYAALSGLSHEAALNAVGNMWGVNSASGAFGIKILRLGQLATIYYFAYFLVILPLLSVFETPRQVPLSISKPVLGGGHKSAHAAAKPMEKA
jgi:ubiquinol-cytochrome c reductase cytochrome b subunit